MNILNPKISDSAICAPNPRLGCPELGIFLLKREKKDGVFSGVFDGMVMLLCNVYKKQCGVIVKMIKF